MKKFLFMILAFFVMASMVSAADSTNASSISILEGDTWLIYYGTITTGTDSTANHNSQAMFIGSSNAEYGGIQVYFTNIPGTEDANGILKYSNDPAVKLANFSSTTYAGLDQISTTAKFDTLGVNAGVNDMFKYSAWMVLQLDGQAGHPAGAVASFFIYLRKNEGAPKKNVGRVKNTT